ncbi:HaeII family restriction endonuclease [Candidatus Woesearchaeota archaeon]|nr:HaeII family restriction endonuclease [Candidatus Woesearchaeota archaeon]
MKSKEALDRIIAISRVHLYKPIQIAEILYRYRIKSNFNISEVESYRNASKRWRDEVSKLLVGRISTSSQKFQDNIFDANAMPPKLLKELAEFNNKNGGIVESYIYNKLKERLAMISDASLYLKRSSLQTFNLRDFLSLFQNNPGLKRSVDKAYEITVYALFSALVKELKVEVTLSMGNVNKSILTDFEKFVRLVVGLSKDRTSIKMPAKLFRVGVTNAADSGLDMWTNFGPAVQVKHVSLSEELAEDVSENIAADKIILVCLDGESELIERVMSQLPVGGRIQGIITISDLECWYKTCFSDKYRANLGKSLLADLQREFEFEFPSETELTPFMQKRGYAALKLSGEWKLDSSQKKIEFA